MNYIELSEKLSDTKREYEAALSRGSGVAVAKEHMKNILFNNCDNIIQGLKEADSLQEEVQALDAALKEADDQARKKRTSATKG